MALELSHIAASIVGQRKLLQNGFMHLPYLSLVNDETIRLRDNAFLCCIRVEGLNAATTPDADLDTLKRSFASVLAQLTPDFTVYTHRVSRKIDLTTTLTPLNSNDFSAAIEQKWNESVRSKALRDTQITISIVKRNSLKSGNGIFAKAAALVAADNQEAELEKLSEVVRFIRAALGNENSRLLGANSGELLGFLGSIQTANEKPIFPSKSLCVLADDVLSDRVTFDNEGFSLTDGSSGTRYGQIRALKTYPPESWVTVFDEFALPCDFVISQSFSPMKNTAAAEKIDSQRSKMKSTGDAREEAAEQLKNLHEHVLVNSKSLGEHHFTISLIHEDKKTLKDLMSDLEGVASNVGARLVKDSFVQKAHYFAQFPGNLSARSRLNIITNGHFADYASLHRTPLGKDRADLPWETPIAVFPTAFGSAYRLSFHRKGNPGGEPPAGHTLILGETGSGKSVLASFLLTQARRTDSRIFVFDYRRGLEMTVRAMRGQYSTIESGKPTGLNPLAVETDTSGQSWLSGWLEGILTGNSPLSPAQTGIIHENVVRNAGLPEALRNWSEFQKMFASADDNGDLKSKRQGKALYRCAF